MPTNLTARAVTVVLKFGGSVLKDRGTLVRAVEEIARHRRAGHPVVAVVSAFAGDTDARLQNAARTSPPLSPFAIAAHVGLGEYESAALLLQALDAHGLPAATLDPAAIGLVASGPPLDASPQDVSTRRLRLLLRRHGTVVVPGFVAIDTDGNRVLLSRGGSDLTALFLARRLGARCRLLKDVNGLFDRDPNQDPAARRYHGASFATALATDGSIVQHRAVAFAQQHRMQFELGALADELPTQIGAFPFSRFAMRLLVPPLRLAVLGLGTVGARFCERVAAWPQHAVVAAVSTRSEASPRRRGVTVDAPWLPPIEAATAPDIDVVVECTGDVEVARRSILAALQAGRAVITANKAVLAQHGDELRAAATRSMQLLASACVGGATPVLERLRRGQAARRKLRCIRGVLNGTTNHVLEDLRRGLTLDAALLRARTAGLCEADAARDLDGRDAADKLAVIAGTAGHSLSPDAIARDHAHPDSIAQLPPLAEGQRWRQVATLELDGPVPVARVRLEAVAATDPLHELPGEWNAVALHWANAGTSVNLPIAPERHSDLVEWLRGRGAGALPTALALLGDLFLLHERRVRDHQTANTPDYLSVLLPTGGKR